MTSRTRLWVLLISTPVIAFAIIGGYLGQVMAKDETYQHLRVFEDVVSLVLNNYVEEVDVKKAMKGAMMASRTISMPTAPFFLRMSPPPTRRISQPVRRTSGSN
jgi:hypothetical protein